VVGWKRQTTSGTTNEWCQVLGRRWRMASVIEPHPCVHRGTTPVGEVREQKYGARRRECGNPNERLGMAFLYGAHRGAPT
jgi:hypothetical protein